MRTARPRPLVAVDLVDVVEDSWPQKRVWLTRSLSADPGPVPRSRAWVESFVRQRLGIDGHAFYEGMSAAISQPESLAARPLVPGAIEGLRRLRRFAEVRLLSGRREAKRAATEAWLSARGLACLTGDALVLLDYRPRQEELAGSPPKVAWCMDHAALALVDNQAAQLAPAPGTEGIARILYSRDSDEYEKCAGEVLVATSWTDVPGLVRVIRRRRPFAA